MEPNQASHLSPISVATEQKQSAGTLSSPEKPHSAKFIEPSTPFEVIHDDLEMYRAIVDAFKLLSRKQERHSEIKKEIERHSAQQHMKRLSLIACGFDGKLAEVALQEKHYDIDAAFEYCQQRHDGPVSPIASPIVQEHEH